MNNGFFHSQFFYIQSNNKEESALFSFMYIEIQNKKTQQLSNKTVLFL